MKKRMGRRKKSVSEVKGEEIVGGGDGLDVILLRELSRKSDASSVAMRNRLLRDTVGDIMSAEVDTKNHVTAEQAFVMNWFSTAMKNGVTSRDMLAYLKLRGEDVQKSQSVNVKLTADAKSVKSTEDFLKDGLTDDGKD